MSREIKFRMWNEITKQMMDLKKITPLALNMDTDGLFIPFCGMPIMQFTGLHDKNGKEIYEGDIISFYVNKPGLVVWTESGWQGHGWSIKVGTDYCNFDKARNSEVLGNIHQHPELLTAKGESHD